MLTPFFEYCQEYETLSSGFIDLITRNAYIIDIGENVEASKLLIARNSVCFVLKGLLKKSLIFSQKEITLDFYLEKEVFGSSMLKDNILWKNDIRLQAIENTQLIMIPYAIVQALLDRYPESHRLYQKLSRGRLRDLDIQSSISRIPDAAERYRLFCQAIENPERFPAKHLASYLGMRSETLSRIKNRNRKI